MTWEIESQIKEAQKTEPDPGTGPPGQLFVPSSVRSQVLQWAHATRLTCHPGVHRTIQFLQRYFWWPTLARDAREYVTACTTCACNKLSNRTPSGLLQPLPTPGRPWSHIALDFVTGLPASRGNTVILTIVDRFSKAAHFVALPKLPTALETAHLLTTHVFRLHGIPEDIVSDRGPSSLHGSGGSFAPPLAQRLVCPLVSTRRLTGKLSGQTKSWRLLCGVWCPQIKRPGVSIYHGLSTPTIA